VHRGGETAGASPGRLATNVTMGKPGSPIPPPAGGFGRAKPSGRVMGKPGFPITRWEGLEGQSPPRSNLCASRRDAARAAWTANVNIRSRRGDGETRFPHAPARGRARPSSRVWENPVSPCLRPREGLGGLRPPKNNRMFIAVLCSEAAWTADGERAVRGESAALYSSPPGGNGTTPVNILIS